VRSRAGVALRMVGCVHGCASTLALRPPPPVLPADHSQRDSSTSSAAGGWEGRLRRTQSVFAGQLAHIDGDRMDVLAVSVLASR